MRFIPLVSIVPVPLVVAAALLSPPVVGSAAAQTAAPSHKHYAEPADAPAPAPGAPLAPRLQNLGVHTFPVSTKVQRAQLFMNQGLNLTYGFNHAEAARAFAEAARLDPNLAMAYWGQALALGPNLNAPMTTENGRAAYVAIQAAHSAAVRATARERGLAAFAKVQAGTTWELGSVPYLPAAFNGFRRVLKPGGLLVCSTFGPETLQELRDAFAQADDAPHVSPFPPIAQFGDALMLAGFRDPVLDRDRFTLTYDDLPALMRELRAMGATNALRRRRHTLTGRARFAAAAAAYEPLRRADGRLPSTWDVIYAHAWAPPAGAPIREQGEDIAAVPLSKIPIRRRGE